MVQEYARYFGLKTGIFRGGCLTGPQHSGVELHGFLNYLVATAVRQGPYTVYGYKGKQVRDQIHSRDVVSAFWAFAQKPRPAKSITSVAARRTRPAWLNASNSFTRSPGSAQS